MPRILYMLAFIALALPAHAQGPIRPKGTGGPMPNLTGRWTADSSISNSAQGARRDVNLNMVYTFTPDSLMLIAKGDEPAQEIGRYSLTREGNKTYMTVYKGDKPITTKMEIQSATLNYMVIYIDYPQATATQYFSRLDKR